MNLIIMEIEIIPWKCKWFLFMSCDALKKTNEWVSLMHRVNKSRSSTFHGMMFLFDTNLDFSQLNSKIGANENETTSFVQSETNDDTWQYKSQYVWNNIFFIKLYITTPALNKKWKIIEFGFRIIYVLGKLSSHLDKFLDSLFDVFLAVLQKSQSTDLLMNWDKKSL